MKHLKHCPICGSDFVTRKRRKKTCSPKCERIREKLEAEKLEERRQRELSKRPPESSLDLKIKKAKAQNLSYGQLQAQKFIKENGI